MSVLEWLVVASSIGIIINFMMFIYVAYFVLEDIEAVLPNTRVVVDAKAAGSGAGFTGRLWRIGMVFNSFVFARSWSKKGIVSLVDISQVPPGKKMWVYATIIIAMISLLVLYFALHRMGRV